MYYSPAIEILESMVEPWWYQDNGTPVCPDCEDDMQYLSTEMLS